MEPIVVLLRGQPQGWQRSGVRIIKPHGKKAFASIYLPAATRNYQKALALQAKVVMGRRPILDEAVRIDVMAVMSVPSSWSRKKRDAALSGTVRPTGKPDFDNIAKMVDGLKGVVWRDDALVVDARIRKAYGEDPYLQIVVQAIAPFEE